MDVEGVVDGGVGGDGQGLDEHDRKGTTWLPDLMEVPSAEEAE